MPVPKGEILSAGDIFVCNACEERFVFEGNRVGFEEIIQKHAKDHARNGQLMVAILPEGKKLQYRCSRCRWRVAQTGTVEELRDKVEAHARTCGTECIHAVFHRS